MPFKKHLTVLIVDDHPLICNAIRHTLDSVLDRSTVLVEHTLESALSTFKDRGNIDLVLLDLNLRDSAGLETVRRFLGNCPGCCVLAMSGDGNADLVRSILELGADGFLYKGEAPPALVEAVHCLLRGKSYVAPHYRRSLPELDIDTSHVQFAGDVLLDPGNKRIQRTSARLENLTGRQRDVLLLISQGMSNKSIARSLGIADGTVKNYIFELCQLYGVSRREALVFRAFGDS